MMNLVGRKERILEGRMQQWAGEREDMNGTSVIARKARAAASQEHYTNTQIHNHAVRRRPEALSICAGQWCTYSIGMCEKGKEEKSGSEERHGPLLLRRSSQHTHIKCIA